MHSKLVRTLAILMSLAAFACNPQPESGDTSDLGARPDLLDTAERYAAAWSSQDPELLASFYSEGGSLKVNDGLPSIGRKTISETAGGFMTAFPDMVVALDSLVVIDSLHAVFHWRWTGTNSGPGGTGRSVDLTGYEEWTLDSERKIVQSLGHYDEGEYERQMGVE